MKIIKRKKTIMAVENDKVIASTRKRISLDEALYKFRKYGNFSGEYYTERNKLSFVTEHILLSKPTKSFSQKRNLPAKPKGKKSVQYVISAKVNGRKFYGRSKLSKNKSSGDMRKEALNNLAKNVSFDEKGYYDAKHGMMILPKKGKDFSEGYIYYEKVGQLRKR